ncbi:hypothetical protein CHN50_05030 [Priestia aryabhattai]|uniref:DinB family protein n=1 Tax=Priestia TaxID=2800373 RepID=UPI000BA02F30|nr:DinB family protein [Priestia flexa]OZT13932.1 hypothetical protein CHN50_05030 [Priestia aryabhattai]USY53644.1 DinB family protein [Bacillus sp. 1780r2a1]
MSASQRLLHHFLAHRNVTNMLIDKIEEHHYDYQPTPTSMSAYKLTTHMLTSFYTFAKIAQEGNLTPLEEKHNIEQKNLSELASHYTEKTKEILASLTDDQLNRIIDTSAVFGQKMPASQLVSMAIDHEIHHKGNLFVYVREMGHTDLPLFVKWG